MILSLDNSKDSILRLIIADYDTDVCQCLKSCWYYYDKFAKGNADKITALIWIAKCYLKMDEADMAVEILKQVIVLDNRNIEAYGLILKTYDDPFSEESYKYYEHDAMSVISKIDENSPRATALLAVEVGDMIMDAYVNYNVYFDKKDSISLVNPNDMFETYVEDIEITACRYGLDEAIAELETLANKYGKMPRYYIALARLNMLFNSHEVAYENVKRGLELDNDSLELLKIKLEIEKMLFYDCCRTLERFKNYAYISEDELFDVIATLFEYEEYETVEKLTLNADFKDKQWILRARACVLYNLRGDNDETKSIFKKMNLLFRDLSLAKHFYKDGELVPPLLGKYVTEDICNAHCGVLNRAKKCYKNCLKAEDNSIDSLSEDVRNMLELTLYSNEFVENDIHKIVRDKFSDQIFIDNEKYFKRLLYNGDISSRICDAVLFRMLCIDPTGEYHVCTETYVYIMSPVVNDMIMGLPEPLRKAYFYCASVMSYCFKFDNNAAYNTVFRLCNTGLYDETQHVDYKAMAATLAKCSYTQMFEYDYEKLTDLFDTRKSRVLALRRNWNKNKNFYSNKEMENYWLDRMTKLVESFRTNFGL